MTYLPKRVTDQGVVDDLSTDDLLAVYTIEYTGVSIENFGVAMFTLLCALPTDRLWSLPVVYQHDDLGVIHMTGIKKHVFEESKA